MRDGPALLLLEFFTSNCADPGTTFTSWLSVCVEKCARMYRKDCCALLLRFLLEVTLFHNLRPQCPLECFNLVLNCE